MKISQLLEATRAGNVVYHGMKANFALQALRADKLEGRTIQRYWPDGKRMKDNQPGYDESFWLKGFSTTRDIKYAQTWGEVVLELDKNKIAQRFKIIPFNWGYSIPADNHHKKEREEFIVTGKLPYTQKQMQDVESEYGRKYDNDEHWLNKAVGKPIAPLHQYITAIYADESLKNDPRQADLVKSLEAHPKFKGYYKTYRSDGWVDVKPKKPE